VRGMTHQNNVVFSYFITTAQFNTEAIVNNHKRIIK
jgi:hypothetical protein